MKYRGFDIKYVVVDRSTISLEASNQDKKFVSLFTNLEGCIDLRCPGKSSKANFKEFAQRVIKQKDKIGELKYYIDKYLDGDKS